MKTYHLVDVVGLAVQKQYSPIRVASLDVALLREIRSKVCENQVQNVDEDCKLELNL